VHHHAFHGKSSLTDPQELNRGTAGVEGYSAGGTRRNVRRAEKDVSLGGNGEDFTEIFVNSMA
jgi:hypothetical protein